MKKNAIFPFVVFLITGLLVLSCKNKQEKEPALPEIKVVKVEQRDAHVYEEFVGQVYGKYDIPIRARVSGFLEGIYFKEGLRVRKGQLLYTIDPQPLEAQVAEKLSRVAEAKIQLVKAKSDLDRIEPLAEINAVSKSDLDAARARYEAARSQVDAANASLRLSKINLSYTRIKSPISGIIGKTNAKVGEFVGQNPNPVILNTVSQIDTVYVEFFLPEKEYLSLARNYLSKQGKADSKRESYNNLELILSDGSIFKHKGSVRFINRNFDPSTGSMLIQAAFPNPEKILRPGLFARVRVESVLKNALVVPLRCILEVQGKYFVFTVDQQGVVHQKSVEAGPLQGDMQVIKSGVTPDDRLVLEGIQMVRSEMKVKPVLKEFRSQSKEN